jgi:hypothetical protein
VAILLIAPRILVIAKREVVVVRTKESIKQHDRRALVAIAERMVRDDCPEQGCCLSREIRLLVSGDVLRPRQRRLKRALIQERITCLSEWDLGRLGVCGERSLVVRILDGQMATAGRIPPGA